MYYDEHMENMKAMNQAGREKGAGLERCLHLLFVALRHLCYYLID